MPTKEQREQAMEISRPLTSKEDRLRHTWGSLLFVMPSNGCEGRKCVRHAGHEGECYPKEG